MEAQARACRISHVSFTVELERVARTRWSGTLLDAHCGDVATILIDTNEAFTAWTFTQMIVTAGRALDPSCGARAAGSVTRFDSAAPALVPLACSGFVPQ